MNNPLEVKIQLLEKDLAATKRQLTILQNQIRHLSGRVVRTDESLRKAHSDIQTAAGRR